MCLRRISRALFLTAALVAILALAPGRQGTALALAITAGPNSAVFVLSLGTSAPVDTAGGTLGVTALGTWYVRVTGSDNGRLRRTCAEGSSLLTNQLKLFATGAPSNFGTSAAPLTLSAGPPAQLVASGNNLVSLLVNVTLTYRYTPSASDQLSVGCPYSETTTIDVSSS